MKRMFLVVTLLIAFVGSSFAQANLYDKMIEKAYNLSVEAIEAGKNWIFRDRTNQKVRRVSWKTRIRSS